MKESTNISGKVKSIVGFIILLLLIVFSCQGFLLKSSNNLRLEMVSLQEKFILFKIEFSEIAGEITEIEYDSQLTNFQKKIKIKKILQLIFSQFEEKTNLKKISYYSNHLNTSFSLENKDGRSYYTISGNSSQNQKDLLDGDSHISAKNLKYQQLLYSNGIPAGYVTLNSERKGKMKIFLSIIPQIVLFAVGLLIIIFFIYNYWKKSMKKTINIFENQLEYFTKKLKYPKTKNNLEEKIPEEFTPIFYNLKILLKQFEDMLYDFSCTSSIKELVPIMAHEVKNPVAVIKGNAQLGMKLDNEAKRNEIFDRIDKSCDMVNRFLNESVQLVRPSSEGRKNIEVDLFIDDLLVVVKPMIKLAGLEFIKSVSSELFMIRVDQVNMTHALINIIKNSVDATPRGGKITLDVYSINQKLYITVTDTGCGISDEMKDKVFQKYFTTKKSKCSGIGLGLAYNVIEDHGGKLWFESTQGKGTTFYIELPLFKIK